MEAVEAPTGNRTCTVNPFDPEFLGSEDNTETGCDRALSDQPMRFLSGLLYCGPNGTGAGGIEYKENAPSGQEEAVPIALEL